MSSIWSWYLIVGTVVSLIACFWLIAWTNRQRQSGDEIAESESHVWDEDIRELNNPLPMWWLYLFIITLVFAVAYVALFPGLGGYAGLLTWSQEDQYEQEIAAAEAKYGPLFASYGAMEVVDLIEDPKALGIGKSLYANYCAQCHGSGGRGARGFPNLTDGAWLYGGAPDQIEHSIVHGRSGVMPALGAALGSEENVEEMIRYVQSMPDGADTSSPAHTQYTTFCSACHGPDGGGMQMLGAPNLKDDSWLYSSSPKEIGRTILEGRNGVMPAHGELIGADRARILSAYVYSLSRPSSD